MKWHLGQEVYAKLKNLKVCETLSHETLFRTAGILMEVFGEDEIIFLLAIPGMLGLKVSDALCVLQRLETREIPLDQKFEEKIQYVP